MGSNHLLWDYDVSQSLFILIYHNVSHFLLRVVIFYGSGFSPMLIFFAFSLIVLHSAYYSVLSVNFLFKKIVFKLSGTVLSIWIEFYKLCILKVCLRNCLLWVSLLENLHHFVFTGHVGAPLPCNMVKLFDVPENECYSKDGKGEVSRLIVKRK